MYYLIHNSSSSEKLIFLVYQTQTPYYYLGTERDFCGFLADDRQFV
jgi:hypothetical protein